MDIYYYYYYYYYLLLLLIRGLQERFVFTIHMLFNSSNNVLQQITGDLIVMWLSGLHIPESYLTALVQMECRRFGWPLDRSTLYTKVSEYMETDDVVARPMEVRIFIFTLNFFVRFCSVLSTRTL